MTQSQSTAPDAPALTIRRARASEYGRIGELTVAAYAPFLEADDAYVDRLRDTALRDREAEVWVAEAGGTVLGCVTLCPPASPWREIARHEGEGEFRMLAVDPAAHGQGLGTALAHWTVAELGRRGCTSVALSSLDRMHAAHRMYERLGFTRAPDRDWRPQPHIDLYVYTKELT